MGQLDSGNAAWILTSASLVFLMTPGVAFFYGGMVRAKAVLNMMIMEAAALSVTMIMWVLWGWSIAYAGTSVGGIFGDPATGFLLKDTMVSDKGVFTSAALNGNNYPVSVDVAFQSAFAMITVALICGAIAERVKYSTWMIFVALWITFDYAPLAHMVWNGGLLSAEALAGHKQLCRTHLTDCLGHEPGRAAVGNVADVDECQRAFCVCRGYLEIAAERKAHARSRDRALYAGDNGLLHIAQAQIHFAAEAAVISRPALSALKPVAHGVQIAACAEAAACSPDDDQTNVVVKIADVKQPYQLFLCRVRDRVLFLRVVQGYVRDMILHLKLDELVSHLISSCHLVNKRRADISSLVIFLF